MLIDQNSKGPTPDSLGSFVEPRHSVEKQLAQIWRDTLGLEQVGVNQSFLELGGDAILSIRVMDKAKRSGIHITPQQFLRHQTIAQLSTVARLGSTIPADQELIFGDIPSTPRLLTFLQDHDGYQHHLYNLPLVLDVDPDINPKILRQAVEHVVRQHDALRMRFVREVSGWRQFIEKPEGELPFTHINLVGMTQEEQDSAIDTAASKAQLQINLSNGPLFQVALFSLGSDKPGLLLLLVNHLVADAYSLPIILADLQTSYEQLSECKVVELPPKTTSFKYWAEQLNKFAQTTSVQQDLDYWLALPWHQVIPFPVDSIPANPIGMGTGTIASNHVVSASLTEEETALLHGIDSRAKNVRVMDLLLTAVSRAVTQWTGSPYVLLEIVKHGRYPFADDIDVSRTVGWLSTHANFLCDLDGVNDPRDAWNRIKDQFRAIPSGGISYELLRYLNQNEDYREKLQSLPKPQIMFNYQAFSSFKMFGHPFTNVSKRHVTLPSDDGGPRYPLLYTEATVVDNRFNIVWMYSRDIHNESTIQRLADTSIESLRTLISMASGCTE